MKNKGLSLRLLLKAGSKDLNGHYQDALELYKQILDVHPGNKLVQRRYAFMQYLTGNKKAALDTLIKLFKKQRFTRWELATSAQLFLDYHHYYEALEAMRRARRKNPFKKPHTYYFVTGAALLSLGKIEEGRMYLEKALNKEDADGQMKDWYQRWLAWHSSQNVHSDVPKQ